MGRARLWILLALASACLASSAGATVPWPAGHIVRGASWSSGGFGKFSFEISGDTTLQVMGQSVPYAQWVGNSFSTAGFVGGTQFSPEAYFGWAPGAPGTLLTLGCTSTTQLTLRSFAWSGSLLGVTTMTAPAGWFRADYGSYYGAPASGGGAWFVFQGGVARPGVRLLRTTSTGAVAPGWPAFGSWIATSNVGWNHDPGLADDGSGGAIVVMPRPGDIMCAYRVNADTTFAAGWPPNGLALEGQSLGYSSGPSPVTLTRSGDSHFIASWQGYAPGGEYIKCQRFSLDGALDPNWPANGIVVRDPYVSDHKALDYQAVADGAGGVTLAWMDSNWVEVRHVRVNGAFGAGYAGGPKRAVDLTPWNMLGQPFGLATGWPGSAAIAYISPQGDLRCRWFDADGAPAPDPAQYDKLLFTQAELAAAQARVPSGGTPRRAIGATGDGEGGVYFAWTGTDSAGVNRWIFISHATWPGPVVLDVPPPASAALALTIGPNPARGALTARFTLPDARPARLELLDLAGRRVAAREVSGAGAHTETFSEVATLSPGVYLMRLEHGGSLRTARVAVIR